jgi:dTDP-4-dehydrorhamnose 3,5-epimerase
LKDSFHVDIAGVQYFSLASHSDDRGVFTENYRREWLQGAQEMVQGNLSRSSRNVLRGLHFHRKQADYWCLIEGAAFVGLYDLRDGSPTQGHKAEISLAVEGEYHGLYIPKGIAHGFYAETDLLLQYLVDQYFTGEDEFGVAWDDPELGITWPARDPILSPRDRGNPALRDALAEAPAYEEAP